MSRELPCSLDKDVCFAVHAMEFMHKGNVLQVEQGCKYNLKVRPCSAMRYEAKAYTVNTSIHMYTACIVGPGDKVCYYYGPKQAVYEELGHAEVVQMELRGESGQTKRQMEAFAETYFGQFRKTPFGMMRLDPQDAGPAYRNVIGIPGGTNSPLFDVLKVKIGTATIATDVHNRYGHALHVCAAPSVS